MRHLVELSGECEDLARAEAVSLALARSETATFERDGRALIIDSPAEAPLLQRMALAWSVSLHEFSCEADDLDSMISSLELPGNKFRVCVRRLDESGSNAKGDGLTKRLGALLSKRHKVSLDAPDVEVRVLLASRAHVGLTLGEIDRPAFEARKAENRPFNHPISLHPRLARALVNLTRVREGQELLDPFCGTGGILIEAGLVGCRALGGDIDPRMVEGSRVNLGSLGLEADIRQLDISHWPGEVGKVDAIATDPPYGRSASTAKEPIGSLYERMFGVCGELLGTGGRLALVLPSEEHAKNAEGFELEGMHPVRVHRSLTRNFCVFRRT